MIIDLDEFSQHSDDIDRIKAILNEHGRPASRLAIYLAWKQNSASSAATWLNLDSDDEIVFYSVASTAAEIDVLLPDLS